MSLQDKLKNAEETMWPLTMGMSIGEAISKLRYELHNNKMASAYAVAIETMRKYKKIQEIVKQKDYDRFNSHNYYGDFLRVQDIRKVLENGNEK